MPLQAALCAVADSCRMQFRAVLAHSQHAAGEHLGRPTHRLLHLQSSDVKAAHAAVQAHLWPCLETPAP